MRQWLKFLMAFAIAAVILLLFRALVTTMYVVGGTALQPEFHEGDRVMVNRWSYGLRTGSDNGLFRYGRLLKSEVKRGDIIAVDNISDTIPGIFIFRCKHLPGDTVTYKGRQFIVPGLYSCDKEDYYWLESVNQRDSVDSRMFGFVGESHIIGRVCMVLYNHNDSLPFYKGYDKDRLFLLK